MTSKKHASIIEMWPHLAFAAIVLLCVVLALVTALTPKQVETESESVAVTLVLDPGHGGFDGGAISDDGSKESDINLAIGLKTRMIAELLGQSTVMTREDDTERTDFAGYSEHEDLVHRTALANNTPGAILMSIHQNDFPTSQPSGAQVLYSAYEGSERLGKLTHSNLIQSLDPLNRRVAEPAPKSLFITANANCPAILVECGFMSNNFEVQKLNDGNYQSSIAVVLIASLMQYLDETEIS